MKVSIETGIHVTFFTNATKVLKLCQVYLSQSLENKKAVG